MRFRPEEVYGKSMSRRTETAYKAKFPDESAQHDEVPDLRRYGKCCGCVEKDHVIIRGDLSGLAAAHCSSAHRGNMVGDWAEVSRGHSRCEITFPCSRDVKETSRENRWRSHPPKDRT